MKHLPLLGLTISLAGGAGCDAHAVRCGPAEVAIIDRDTGAALATHAFRGEYWVAGRPGARYAVEIRNRTGERLLAVASVDGINVISGETAAWSQTGYVFAPWERYDITGWRKSDSEVAAFTFTASPNSYAERTCRPANVGVIGVALFQERRPQPDIAPGPDAPMSGFSDPGRARELGAAAGLAEERSMAPAAAPKLGTGHGERERSYVSNTEFDRMGDQPCAVIRIRYDSLENLVAMGIVPRPTWPSANPFPGSSRQGYVPDPPG